MQLNWTDVLELYEEKDCFFLSWKGMVIKALSYKDVYISVHDGEEWVVSKSRSLKDIREAVESVDDCRLIFWSTKRATKDMLDPNSEERHSVERKGKRYWHLGEAYVVLWNSLYDSVSDTTLNQYMDLFCNNPYYVDKYAKEGV